LENHVSHNELWSNFCLKKWEELIYCGKSWNIGQVCLIECLMFMNFVALKLFLSNTVRSFFKVQYYDNYVICVWLHSCPLLLNNSCELWCTGLLHNLQASSPGSNSDARVPAQEVVVDNFDQT
jgi:hypothetical protein